MENGSEFKKQTTFAKGAATFITSLKLAANHLARFDLNPHEGCLRESGMPVKHMNIPDYPPIIDDNPEI